MKRRPRLARVARELATLFDARSKPQSVVSSRPGWQTPPRLRLNLCPATGGLTLRNPQSSAPAPVAHPPMGKTQSRSVAHAG